MIRTRVGYTGGSTAGPTYHHLGDHTESFQVDFDPARLSYADLLEAFWAEHDPTEGAWSRQYMSALFWSGEAQRVEALASRERLAARLGKKVRTPLAPLETFYPAEDYHQHYYLRGRTELFAEFTLRGYAAQAFRESPAAAVLNGFVGGYGTRAQLEALLPRLGLSEAGRQRVWELAGRRSAFRCS